MDLINIGLIGYGVVGQGVVKILKNRRKFFRINIRKIFLLRPLPTAVSRKRFLPVLTILY